MTEGKLVSGATTLATLRTNSYSGSQEVTETDEAGRPRVSHPDKKASGGEQLSFFVAERPPGFGEAHRRVLAELLSLSLDATTPLEALNALARWKKDLE